MIKNVKYQIKIIQIKNKIIYISLNKLIKVLAWIVLSPKFKIFLLIMFPKIYQKIINKKFKNNLKVIIMNM